MSSVGIKIDQFDIPVCNCFQAKILNDQVCYEIDLNKFFDENSTDIESGFNFIMDYNEDRQVTFNTIDSKKKRKMAKIALFGMAKIASKNDQEAFIYLDTIGNFIFYNFPTFKTVIFQRQLS